MDSWLKNRGFLVRGVYTPVVHVTKHKDFLYVLYILQQSDCVLTLMLPGMYMCFLYLVKLY